MTLDNSENTKRIAKNTMMLYIRMMFSMLVSLYTSRVILAALGVEDYGIYNVVGGFVAMFSLFSTSLSASVSRYLTFELGKQDKKQLRLVFTTSLFIHLLLGLVILILAEIVGVWFLNTHLTIPESRLYAANWVFQASLISFVFALLGVSFNASIISHEKMGAFAAIGIGDVTLRLLIVLFIGYASFEVDRLILYSILMTLVVIVVQLAYYFYCKIKFEECSLNFTYDKKCLKEMSSFAGWNFIGCSAGLLKEQGVNILLNIFIGPVLNAARGLAGSVNSAITSFAWNFMAALNPQITKNYALSNYSYTFSLVERGSKFSFYILFILALPVLLETDFILTLWLKNYPEHTVNFIRLILILSLCDIISNTLITLQLATGKIRNYQIAVGGTLLMNFPLSWLCLYLGYPPESTLVVAIFISLCCLFLRLFFLNRMVGLCIRHYLKEVCFNAIKVAILSSVVPIIMRITIDEGWISFLSVCIVSVISTGVVIYFFGCTLTERDFLKAKATSFLQRSKVI